MFDKKIAVLIPCYNEEKTICSVIRDFRKELPNADIYVYDNNSTDRTAKIARASGAIVRRAPIQGKGAVVKQMFNEIDADIYIMVDGDATYPAKYVHAMIARLKNNDMVLGDRLHGNYYADNKRPFHGIGNFVVRFLVNLLYHGDIADIMTGYRAFSRNFVKNVELKSNGFEIETEMSIWALKHKCRIGAVIITYLDRPDGSESKLNTFSDGLKVIRTIFKLKFNK